MQAVILVYRNGVEGSPTKHRATNLVHTRRISGPHDDVRGKGYTVTSARSAS